jgi:hypothetical protein
LPSFASKLLGLPLRTPEADATKKAKIAIIATTLIPIGQRHRVARWRMDFLLTDALPSLCLMAAATGHALTRP